MCKKDTLAQVEVSGVFGKIFSPFQRPDDEKCSDRSQILLVMIHVMIVHVLSYLPPNKWGHPCTPGFSGWCKVQSQPGRKGLRLDKEENVTI